MKRNQFRKTDFKNEFVCFAGELVAERADMIVAPLTINPERAQAGLRTPSGKCRATNLHRTKTTAAIGHL